MVKRSANVKVIYIQKQCVPKAEMTHFKKENKDDKTWKTETRQSESEKTLSWEMGVRKLSRYVAFWFLSGLWAVGE